MRKLTSKELKLIKNNILGIRTVTLSERLEKESEAIYMAMCLLMPKESFLKEVEKLGGLDTVIADYTAQESLAKVFGVELSLAELRVREFYIEKLQNQKEQIDKKIEETSEVDIDIAEIKENAIESIRGLNEEALKKLQK